MVLSGGATICGSISVPRGTLLGDLGILGQEQGGEAAALPWRPFLLQVFGALALSVNGCGLCCYVWLMGWRRCQWILRGHEVAPGA